jgi:hypothetical protein
MIGDRMAGSSRRERIVTLYPTKSSMGRGTGGVRAALFLGVAVLAVVGCGGGTDRRSDAVESSVAAIAVGGATNTQHAVQVDTKDGAGLQLDRSTLDTMEQQQATTFAAGYVSQLVDQHPELHGLTVAGISPVFDEHTPHPIGAMARLTLPAAVPSVTLDLIRLHKNTPEVITSQITNLRALEVIYLFAQAQVVHLGIEPQPGDAADPATATAVTPVDPGGHASPDFAGAE